MGEYIRNSVTGNEQKIGTLDHCFFSRRQIKEWLDDPSWTGWYGGKAEDGTLEHFYNSPDTLYDGIEGLHHKDFAIKIILGNIELFEHKQVRVEQKGKRINSYHFTVDCQLKGSKEIWAYLIGERYDKDGNGRTIFACDCCKQWFSLTQKEIDELLANLDDKMREYLKPILKACKAVL